MDYSICKILVIDDDPVMHLTYQKFLAHYNVKQQKQRSDVPQYEMASAMSGEEGLHKFTIAHENNTPYGIIYLDMRMPDGWDGLETAQRIREIDPTVMILLLTAHEDHKISKVRKLVGSNFEFLTKPINPDELQQVTTVFARHWQQTMQLMSEKSNAARHLEQQIQHERIQKSLDEQDRPIRILFVDDSATVRAVYSNLLQQQYRYDIMVAGSVTEAMEVTQFFTPDIAILDYYLPDGTGADLSKMLLKEESTRNTLILAITQKDDIEEAAIDSGAMDVLYKDDPHAIFIKRIASLERHVRNQLALNASLALQAQAQAKMQIQAKEQERIRAEARELQLRQEWLESILASIPEGLLILEGDSRIVKHANPAAQAMFGSTLENLCGEHVDRLLERSSIESDDDVDFVLRNPDGHETPVVISNAEITTPSMEDQGEILVLHDVHMLVHAREARRASKAKDDFLASMSHELRTPLTSIIGNSELLSETVLNDKQHKLLRSVEISSRGLLALINDVLDMSKIEAGKFKVDQSEYTLQTLLHEIEHIFKIRTEDAGLQFIIEDRAQPSHQLIGDGRRIGQILINLLSNAIKFSQQNGSTVKLVAAIDTSAEVVSFAVSDEGIGMSTEVLERLFQPFEQADQSISRRFGGTGLGLHISWTLARLMNGTIQVESTEGAGSTFELRIPLITSNKPVEEKSEARATVLQESLNGEVLIAEDTPELQLLQCRILESMQVDVTLAKNGAEAVDLALNHPFDLILMDMQMPEMDGIEATSMLRSLGCDTPIVALTANVMQHHRDQFEQAGCNGFLSKPIDRQALYFELTKHLQSGAVSDSAPAPIQNDQLIDEELTELFTERTKTLREELGRALEVRNWEGIRSISHMVKGSGTTFGYPEMTAIGKEVCDAIDQEKLNHAEEHAQTLLDEMKKI